LSEVKGDQRLRPENAEDLKGDAESAGGMKNWPGQQRKKKVQPAGKTRAEGQSYGARKPSGGSYRKTVGRWSASSERLDR